ncbi:MAG: site-specific integrase [Clostridia bacterium]|nr:site-specific integrase [Clostridia bacterium]
MPRRARAEMSWVPDKQKWRKQIKDPSGKYVPVYGATKQEVRDRVAARQAAWAAEASAQVSPDFAALAVRWATLTATDASPRVRAYRQSALNNYILPVLGEIEAAALREEDVLRLKQTIAAMSRDSQTKILAIVRNICKFAAKNGYMTADPADGVKAAGPPPKEVDPLTPDQAAALLAAVKGTQTETFCRLCLHAGLRREEALALRWDCVHLDGPAPFLEVRRALRWPTNAAPEISDRLKSKAAKRDIPLPASLAAHLRAVRAATGSLFVIHNREGGPVSYSSWRSLWRVVEARTAGERGKVGDKVRNHAVVISLDFPVHPHQLRHTYCTRLILGGVDVKRVQYLMGHASARITLEIYTKLMSSDLQDTASAVRKIFA